MDSQFVYSAALRGIGMFVSSAAAFYALIEGLRRYRRGLTLHPDGDDVPIDFLGVKFNANLKTVGAVVILTACASSSLAYSARPMARMGRTEGSSPRPDRSIEQRPEQPVPVPTVPAPPSEAVQGQIRGESAFLLEGAIPRPTGLVMPPSSAATRTTLQPAGSLRLLASERETGGPGTACGGESRRG
jgi:hypothetical protein